VRAMAHRKPYHFPDHGAPRKGCRGKVAMMLLAVVMIAGGIMFAASYQAIAATMPIRVQCHTRAELKVCRKHEHLRHVPEIRQLGIDTSGRSSRLSVAH
jgi:hypothetical protein